MTMWWQYLNSLEGKKQYKKARRWLLSLSDSHNADAFFWARLANVCRYLHRYDEALEYIQKAKRLKPNSGVVAYNAGLLFLDKEWYNSAAAQWDIILNQSVEALTETDSCDSRFAQSLRLDALMYKAICWNGIGELDSAKALAEQHLVQRKRGLYSDFSKAEVICFISRSEHPASANGRLMDRQEREKFQQEYDKCCSRGAEESVKFLNQYLQQYPGEYYLYEELSFHYATVRKVKESLKAALYAYMVAPEDFLVVFRYGEALRINSRYDEAIGCYDHILRRKLSTIAYGEHGEGVKWAKWLKNEARLMKAICLLQTDDKTAANKCLKQHLLHRERGIHSVLSKREVLRLLAETH